MSLEELTQRATITFPILATVEDVERLFGYLRQEAGLITHYTLNVQKRIGSELEEPQEQEVPKVKDYRLDAVVATHPSSITDAVTGVYVREEFHCSTKIAHDGNPYFSGMKFFTTPGWSLGDYRQETLRLWDQVRELTDKYFELRKPNIK